MKSKPKSQTGVSPQIIQAKIQMASIHPHDAPLAQG